MGEPLVLCPVCRVAVPDKDYYRHAQKHQERESERKEGGK